MKDFITKEDWPKLIYGLRKYIGVSQENLSQQIKISRKNIGRYEKGQRIPREDLRIKILEFLKKENINVTELIKNGEEVFKITKDRERAKALQLPESKELAELIGIILGDGEIRKDGSIRIAFDPKKDLNFLYKRVFLLTEKILPETRIGFESYKRVCFGNISFVRYLKETCGLNAGNKFENNWEIPPWCFKKEEYLSATLRGLFDTDGYFAYTNGSLEVMYGRFSIHATKLVENIKRGLLVFSLNAIIIQDPDGRYPISIYSKEDILIFFGRIGTSNHKHIVRFLLWRINKYEAKIEKEGLKNLMQRLEFLIPSVTKNIHLPFIWNRNQQSLLVPFVTEDIHFLEGIEIRNAYKWAELFSDLLQIQNSDTIGDQLDVTARTVRRWREGTRIPNPNITNNILRIAEKNTLILTNYKQHGKRNS
ncbi:MAG: LAGLIDADG family homing endonuclease [bacterium]|nr:LAGLIDADG family homing endonuclease [bacterium]